MSAHIFSLLPSPSPACPRSVPAPSLLRPCYFPARSLPVPAPSPLLPRSFPALPAPALYPMSDHSVSFGDFTFDDDMTISLTLLCRTPSIRHADTRSVSSTKPSRLPPHPPSPPRPPRPPRPPPSTLHAHLSSYSGSFTRRNDCHRKSSPSRRRTSSSNHTCEAGRCIGMRRTGCQPLIGKCSAPSPISLQELHSPISLEVPF